MKLQLNEYDLTTLEELYDKIKIGLGNKIAECREIAGFPKRSYYDSAKSANILFNTESGKNFPNLDTLNYYMELYQVNERTKSQLLDLHSQGKQVKREIIRKKRGWK
jgi:hypothetical protein